MATETPSAPTPNPTESAPAPAAPESGESTSTEQNSTLLTDGKPEEGKPDEKPADKPADKPPEVPEKYDIKLGEGQELDTAALDAMTPVFKELGLTQESAQKLVGKFAEYAAEASKQAQAKQDEQFQGWLKAEREKGVATIRKEWGANFDANAKTASEAYAHFGGSEVTQILKETGLGDHPAFLKMFLKIGPLIQEDKPNANGREVGRKPLEQRLYGETH